MAEKSRNSLVATVLAACLAAASACGCSALESYSRRAGANACASFDRCLVYDDSGPREAACFAPWGERPTVIAGQYGWPFAPGVCDEPTPKHS